MLINYSVWSIIRELSREDITHLLAEIKVEFGSATTIKIAKKLTETELFKKLKQPASYFIKENRHDY